MFHTAFFLLNSYRSKIDCTVKYQRKLLMHIFCTFGVKFDTLPSSTLGAQQHTFAVILNVFLSRSLDLSMLRNAYF